MEELIKLLVRDLGDERVKQNIDLSEHMETGLGSLARAFYIATTKRELIRVIQLCKELKIKYLVMGSGSKMALSEKGFEGLVIKNRSDSLKIFGIKGKVSRAGIGIEEAFLEADSGTSLKRLAEYAARQGLGGLEVLENTLGTLGGSLYILPALREKIHQVETLTPRGVIKVKQLLELSKEDIILSATFKLKAKK